MHVFIVDHTADCRFMHLYIIGNISQDKGFEEINAVVKKILLKFDDALGHFIDSVLSLLDTLNQPGGRLNLIFDVFFPFSAS